jgi:sec-independent protein translocase protein TatA
MIPGFGIGPMELMVVAVVAVVLFGSKLPDVARNMGRSYHQFRQGLNDLKSSINTDPPNYNVDTMPRHERIRHYADARTVDAPNGDDTPFLPPPSNAG